MMKTICFVLFLFSTSIYTSESVTVSDILKSSSTFYPDVHIALERLREQEGSYLAATGAFDTHLDWDYSDRLNGYYSGEQQTLKLTQPFQQFNTKLFAQYRRSDGNFPIYEDELYTDDNEFGIGLTVSLLRNRAIDPKRFKLFKNAGNIEIAKLKLTETLFGIQHSAYNSYLKWVSAGLEYDVYKQLLSIANKRQKAINEKVKRGDAPNILKVENSQLISMRKELLLKAKQKLQNASISLSLFYRDMQGNPITLSQKNLPKKFPTLKLLNIENLKLEIHELTQANPRLSQLDTELEITAKETDLNQNNLLPELDLTFKHSDDSGNTNPERSPAESMVSLQFSLPIQRRLDNGHRDSIMAKQKQLTLKRQLTLDKLHAQFNKLLNNLTAAKQLLSLSKQQIKAAKQLEKAEWTLFTNGQSDFLRTNIREVNTVKAQINYIQAQKNLISIYTDLYALMWDKSVFFLSHI